LKNFANHPKTRQISAILVGDISLEVRHGKKKKQAVGDMKEEIRVAAT